MAVKGGEVGSVKALKKSLKKSSSGGSQFLKRVPEDGITVRFLTEPDKWVEYFEHYDEDRDPRSYPCSDDCEGCEQNLRKSKRYLCNALDLDDGKRVVPLVLPTSLANMLMKRYDRFNTLMDRDYELSKEGSGLDTEYSEAYEAPSRRNIAKFDLLDLWAILEQQLDPDAEDDDEDDDEGDDEEEPRRVVRRPVKRAAKKPARSATPDDDDDEEEERKRVVRRKSVAKKSPPRRAVTGAPPPRKKAINKKKRLGRK